MLKIIIIILQVGFFWTELSKAGDFFDSLPSNSISNGSLNFKTKRNERKLLIEIAKPPESSHLRRHFQRSKTIDLNDENQLPERSNTAQSQVGPHVNSLAPNSCSNQSEQFRVTKNWMEFVNEAIKPSGNHQLEQTLHRSESTSIQTTEEDELAKKDALTLNEYFSGIIKYGTFVPPFETDVNQNPNQEVFDRWIEFQSQQSNLSSICNPTIILTSDRCKKAIDNLQMGGPYKMGTNFISSILGISDSVSSPRSLVALIAGKINRGFQLAQEYTELKKQDKKNKIHLRELKGRDIIELHYKEQLKMKKDEIDSLIKTQNDMNRSLLENEEIIQRFKSASEEFLSSVKFLNNTEEAPIKSVFANFLQNYYGENDISIKRDIFNGLLSQYPQTISKESLKNILASGGPVLHKLFQFMGETSKDQNERGMLSSFKSELRPMSNVDFQLARKRLFGGNAARTVTNLNGQPLAIASVGQVHLGSSVDGREIIVKLLKPDLKTKTSSELSFLNRLIPSENYQVIKNVIDSLSDSINGELDLTRERRMLKKAKIYNKPRDRIFVVEPIKNLSSNSILAMSKASGLPIYQVATTAENACSKLDLLSKLLKNWLDEALFGSGFFHGDLHGGNIVYDEQQRKLELIDFGNAEELSTTDRRGIIKLIAGVTLEREEIVYRALLDLGLSRSQVNSIQDFISEVIEDNFLTEEGKKADKISLIMKEIQRRDLPLSHGLVLFNRGRLLIEGQIKAIVDEMNSNLGGMICTDSNNKPLGDTAKLYKKSFQDGIPTAFGLLGMDTFSIIQRGYQVRAEKLKRSSSSQP